MNSLSKRVIFSALSFVLALGFVSTAIAELQVEGKPRWGFDGSVVPQRFNLLTVTFFNNSPDPWQGTVELKPMMGIQSTDVPIRQDLFLESFGTRDVQFYAFMPNTTEFGLACFPLGDPRGADRYEVDSAREARSPITIELISETQRSSSRDFPTFEERLFPDSAIVMDYVAGIILDHSPKFQQTQMQAFRDWLHAGGRVYLVPDSLGEYPEFPATLSELNTPADRTVVGSGVVTRLTAGKFPPKNPKPEENSYRNYNDNQTAQTAFYNLRSITTPDHNWPLIYLMAVVYLLVLFPGCWLLGRKRGDYRLTYAVIVGTVGLFSFGFHTVGKRGYGETTSINAVVLAKSAEPGRWLVKQWSNFFVTSGGRYLIEHPVSSAAYSSGQFNESIRGRVTNQPIGEMETEIPSFSNRTIYHSGVQKLTGFRPEVESIEFKEGRLDQIDLRVPDDQTKPETVFGFAIFKNEVYSIADNGDGTLSARQQTQRKLGSYVDESTLSNSYGYSYFGRDSEEKSPQQLFDRILWPVIADDLGIRNAEDLNSREFASDSVHVYLKTDLSEDFYATASGEVSPQQSGYVIYSFRVPVEPDDATETTAEQLETLDK